MFKKISLEFDFLKVLIKVDVTHSNYASFTNDLGKMIVSKHNFASVATLNSCRILIRFEL